MEMKNFFYVVQIYLERDLDIDATNKISEDIEARNFINLVSVPIKIV
jgi:hypothetical protein